MADHNYFANLIWQIADLLRGPYRPPQYERVMLPMTVLRRFDSVLAPTKAKVLAEHERWGSKLKGEALDSKLNKAAGQRFHNHSELNFEKLKGDPDHVAQHLVGYIHGFSGNVHRIFEYFEFENEIEKMREANILYSLSPSSVTWTSQEVTRYSKGVWSSLLRLYPEGFFEAVLPVPSRDEQMKIVSIIRKETAKLDAMSAATARTIALLKERRAALIAAAVTGQIDVGRAA